jgi:hypothetical protein
MSGELKLETLADVIAMNERWAIKSGLDARKDHRKKRTSADLSLQPEETPITQQGSRTKKKKTSPQSVKRKSRTKSGIDEKRYLGKEVRYHVDTSSTPLITDYFAPGQQSNNVNDGASTQPSPEAKNMPTTGNRNGPPIQTISSPTAQQPRKEGNEPSSGWHVARVTASTDDKMSKPKAEREMPCLTAKFSKGNPNTQAQAEAFSTPTATAIQSKGNSRTQPHAETISAPAASDSQSKGSPKAQPQPEIFSAPAATIIQSQAQPSSAKAFLAPPPTSKSTPASLPRPALVQSVLTQTQSNGASPRLPALEVTLHPQLIVHQKIT